jgi:hypothetical protein
MGIAFAIAGVTEYQTNHYTSGAAGEQSPILPTC